MAGGSNLTSPLAGLTDERWWKPFDTWSKRVEMLVKIGGWLVLLVTAAVTIVSPIDVSRVVGLKRPAWSYIGKLVGPPTYSGVRDTQFSSAIWAQPPVDIDRLLSLPGQTIIAPPQAGDPLVGREAPSTSAKPLIVYKGAQCLLVEQMSFTPFLRVTGKPIVTYPPITFDKGVTGAAARKQLLAQLPAGFDVPVAACKATGCPAIAIWAKTRTQDCNG